MEALMPKLHVFVLLGFSVADLVRFELTASSMPFKKYQSLADNLAKNKGFSLTRFGRRWTPPGELRGIWTPFGLQEQR